MSEHIWAKVYLELPTDPKLVARSAHDRYLWVCLILIAKGNHDERGIVPGWQTDPDYLSKYTAIGKSEVVRAIDYFKAVGMIQVLENGDYCLTMFKKRQGSVDATAAERKRRERDRRRDSHGDVTQDVTRDSHDTRGREDRTPSGYLQKTEAEAEERNAQGASLSPSGKTWFDDFLAACPKKANGMAWDRSEAGKAWRQYVAPCDQALAVKAAEIYAASDEGKKSPMAPHSFLSRNWRGVLDTARTTSEPSHIHAHPELSGREILRQLEERGAA